MPQNRTRRRKKQEGFQRNTHADTPCQICSFPYLLSLYFIIIIIFFVSVHSVVLFFFLPSSRVSHKEPRLFPLCPLNSCTCVCVSLFISMRCLSPFASKEPIYKRYFEFDDDFLLFVQCSLSFTLYKKIKQMKTTNDGAKK